MALFTGGLARVPYGDHAPFGARCEKTVKSTGSPIVTTQAGDSTHAITRLAEPATMASRICGDGRYRRLPLFTSVGRSGQ